MTPPRTAPAALLRLGINFASTMQPHDATEFFLLAWRATLLAFALGATGVLAAALWRARRAAGQPGAGPVRQHGLARHHPLLAIAATLASTAFSWSPEHAHQTFAACGAVGCAAWLVWVALRGISETAVVMPWGLVPGLPWIAPVRWEEVQLLKDGYLLTLANRRPLLVRRDLDGIRAFASAAFDCLPRHVLRGDYAVLDDLYEDAGREHTPGPMQRVTTGVRTDAAP